MNDYNKLLFELYSRYLNENSRLVTIKDMNNILKYEVSKEYAFGLFLTISYGIDVDSKQGNKFFHDYIMPTIKELNPTIYKEDPYYKAMHIMPIKHHNWEIKYDKYTPYEGFVYDDVEEKSGLFFPKIGFFSDTFWYLAVYENDRLWMSITPNEIETMKEPIKNATGNCYVMGLGLGYFAYMIARKDDVESVTIIEKDPNVIELFNHFILPNFEAAYKIHIINADALQVLSNLPKEVNYVFVDLWHDVSDGIPWYKKLKKYRSKYYDKTIDIWIEQTLKCYEKM